MAGVVVGLVASGAGLASLAIQLLEKAQSIRDLYTRTKNAPDTLLSLGHELETVSLLLRQLETHRQHDSYDHELLGRCMSQCHHSATRMDDLVKKLEQRLSNSRLVGKITVALRDDEFRRLLGELENAKSSIMLAFQMYSFSMQVYQDQQRQFELSQFRSDAEAGTAAIHTELKHLKQSVWIRQQKDFIFTQSVEPTDSSTITLKKGRGLEKDQLNQSVVRRCEDKSSRKTHRKSQGRASYQYSFNFSWLTGKIWDFAANRAENGWDFRIRAWNLRPVDAEIFIYCRKGDVNAVRRLLQNGEASIYDVFYGRETILEVAAIHRHYNLCQFLLTETELKNAGVAHIALDAIASCWHSESRPLTPFYRLWIENSDFDPDIHELAYMTAALRKSTPWWLHLCSDQDSIKIIQNEQATPYLSWPLDKRIELSMEVTKVVWFCGPWLFLKWIGTEDITHELALFKTSDGRTPLHLAAEGIARAVGEGEEAAASFAVQFAIDLISLGAEISADWGGRTPFVGLVRTAGEFYIRSSQRQLNSDMKRTVELWKYILRDCGVDFRGFVQAEQALLEPRLTESDSLKERGPIGVRQLTIDVAGNDWKTEIQAKDRIRVYRRLSIPGAWQPEALEVPKICWRPTPQEREEGHWVFEEDVRIYSSPWIVEEKPTQHIHVELGDLLSESQDDHGIIALRVNKRRPFMALRRSRSIGRLPQTQASYEDWGDFVSVRTRRWLPCAHVCPYDGRLRLDCLVDNDVQYFRQCCVGISTQGGCVQDTFNWKGWSFTACEKWKSNP